MSLQDETFTLGVEEEFQIIDPLTYELSPNADLLLPEAQKLLGEGVQNELMLSQIEIATPVCQTLTDVQTELTRFRQGIIDVAARMGRQIAAGGTHPFSPWQVQENRPPRHSNDLLLDHNKILPTQVIFC